jgi:hypothetical protein
VIAAGIRDDAAAAVFFAQGNDLVVGSAQLEGADGLQVFELEEELAGVDSAGPFEQGRADSDAIEACTGLLNVS